MRRLALYFVLFPLFISCATSTTKAPLWVSQTYDATYPQSSYLAAVGSGSDRAQAVDRARTALSQIFSTLVQSTVVLSSHTTMESGSETVDRFRESSDLFEWTEIQTLSDHLVGSEVANLYTDADRMVHAQVVMDRKKSAEHYRKEREALLAERSNIALQRAKSSDPLTVWMLLAEELALARQEDMLSLYVATLTEEYWQSSVASLLLEQRKVAERVRIALSVVAPEGAMDRIATRGAAWISEVGFCLDPAGPYQLTIAYDDEVIEMAGSPYAHVRYHLRGSLSSPSTHYITFESSKRETALNEREARSRAIESAARAATAEITEALIRGASSQ